MKIQKWLYRIGLAVMAIGFMAGLLLANVSVVTPSQVFPELGPTTKSTFVWSIALMWWIGSAVGGGILLGLSQMIENQLAQTDELRKSRSRSF
ncbi:hypothetical protein [Thermoactinomyces sp. DSM 45892]|uniref:hypothetical protein n=1 Tax=Thermoactinomyces sp. DSM 45892 TaxID=1882753 RepID=UPI00089D79D0|nr:hypothetical protein [Thermoactinomyces sp. DSM 45892]SDX94752.1 hypothetical protein SAMN05444416_10177 [Thermoactinomyces sp. DSM 45892]